MKTIVLDPGHGGTETGATNGPRQEKDDNLRLGLAVRDRLQPLGYNVIMTRDTDVNVPLLERSAIANRNNADIFVSLHRNSTDNSVANGVENIVQPGSPPINTTYARNVLNQVVDVGVQSNRGVKQDDLSVLRNTVAPAQLLEMGFISNTLDNRLFDTEFGGYADAITRGILQSLGEPVPSRPSPPNAEGDPVIRSIQTTLNNRYSAELLEDGFWGPLTRKAMVRSLQTELNHLFGADLTVNGLFDQETENAIPLLRSGTRGNLVYLLQAALYAAGAPVDLDGVFGEQTELALMEYQRVHGLRADGIAGPQTFSSLF